MKKIKLWLGIITCLCLLTNSAFSQSIVQCGSFTLTFEDIAQNNNIGFDNPTPVTTSVPGVNTEGELRVATFCKVIEYIETIIDVGSVNPSITIRLSETDGTGALGFASPYFDPVRSSQSIIYSGKLHEHITSGTDPDPNNPDAFITFDFGFDYNSDYLVTNIGHNQADLFTTALHEISHAMGFMTLIEYSGVSSLSGQTTGPYTHYDQFLIRRHVVSGSPLDVNVISTSPSINFNNQQLNNDDIFYSHQDNSTDYPVFSPFPSHQSMLSHFDKYRAYSTGYVMHYNSDGALQRQWAQAEIEVWCNLGYTVKGDKTNYPYGCADNFAVGVQDDYVGIKGVWSCNNDILANDFDNDQDPIVVDRNYGDNGLQLVTGGDIDFYLDQNDNLCYRPGINFCGTALIRYRPMDKLTGRPGSVTSITIDVDCGYCPGDPCNYICNSDFEEGVTLDVFEDEFSWHNDFKGPYPLPSFVPYWWGFSTDLYIRGSDKLGERNGIPNNAMASGVDTYSGPPNNRYAGAHWGNQSEHFATELIPSWSGLSDLHFKAYVQHYQTQPTNNPTIEIWTGPDADLGNATLLTTFTVTKYDSWEDYTYKNFYSQNGHKFLFIYVTPTNDGSTGYMFIDGFKLNKVGPNLSITKNVDKKVVAPGDIVNYTITVCNSSDVAASNIVVQDILPAGLTQVGNVLDINGKYTIPGSLVSNGCHTFTVQAQVDPDITTCQYIANCASIAISYPSGKCAQNEDCVDILVQPNIACACFDIQVHRLYETVDCGSIIDLESFNHPCEEDGIWVDESTGEEVTETSVATIGSQYTFTSLNGCCITELYVSVNVNGASGTQNSVVEICGPTLIGPQSCPQAEAIGWSWTVNGIPEPHDGNGKVTLNPGDQAVVTTTYANGCQCIDYIDARQALGESLPPLTIETCFGEDVWVQAYTYLPSGYTVEWDNDGNQTSQIGHWYYDIEVNTSGVANLLNEHGCIIKTRTFTINTSIEEPASIGLCKGETYTLVFPVGTYDCSVTSNDNFTENSACNYTFAPNHPGGVYTVKWRDANGVCHTKVFNIYYYSDQETIDLDPLSTCVGGCVEITPDCPNTYANNFSWSDGYQGPTPREVCVNDPNISLFVSYSCYKDNCLLETYNVTVNPLPTNVVDHGVEPDPMLLCHDENPGVTKCQEGTGTTTKWYDDQGNELPNGPDDIQTGESKEYTKVVTGPGQCDKCKESYFIQRGHHESNGDGTVIRNINHYHENATTPLSNTYDNCDGCVHFYLDQAYNTIFEFPLPNCKWVRAANNGPLSNYTYPTFNDPQYPEAMDGLTPLAPGFPTWADNPYGGFRICFNQLSTEPEYTAGTNNGVHEFCYECESTESDCIAERVCFRFTYTVVECKRTITSITIDGNVVYTKPEVSIYPNPSNGVFTLELKGYNLDETSYTVIDATGRVVLQVDNVESVKSSIDMTQFEKGIYFIRVKNNDGVETKKIIIQ